MANFRLLPFLLLVFQTQPGHCFINVGDIFDSIVEGIKSAFHAIVRFIVNAVKSFLLWAVETLRSTVTSLATDMFTALTEAGKGVRERANDTLSEIFGVLRISQAQVLLKMMHTGPLPREYYYSKINLLDELLFLDELIGILISMTTFAACVAGLVLLLECSLLCCFSLAKRELKQADILEEEVASKLGEAEAKRMKAKIEEDKKRQERKQAHIMKMIMMGGGGGGRPRRRRRRRRRTTDRRM